MANRPRRVPVSRTSSLTHPLNHHRWNWTFVFSLALACAGIAALPGLAMAWGKVGHRASAKAAEARLSPAARAAVSALLEPGETLADASTWADEVRRDHPESGPWHYVNVPITEPKYSDKFCGEKGCVVGKIADFRKVLADPNSPRAERQKALRFLTHFLQDMHQPVHVGDRGDRGGNDLQVQFFGKGSNLHRVWDSGLVEREFAADDKLAAELTAQAAGANSDAWATGTVEDWANESLEAARGAYNEPVNNRPLKKGEKLGDAYQAVNFPVARERLARSAVRLAAVLNEALAGAE